MKNIKKSLRSVFCALLAAAALAASLPAYAVSQAEIDDLQKKLDALEQQAQEQQDVINDLTSQKARFITRKLALDNKIEINRHRRSLTRLSKRKRRRPSFSVPASAPWRRTAPIPTRALSLIPPA